MKTGCGSPDNTEAHDCHQTPCSSPSEGCGKDCSDQPESIIQGETGWIQKNVKTAFYRGLELCLDQLKHEPKTMLIVGGARQVELSRELALLLPFTKLFVLDPDEETLRRGQESICCRFEFIEAPLEKLPFDTGLFDVTIAHNVFECVSSWPEAMSELARVTSETFIPSWYHPLWKPVIQRLPGGVQAIEGLGCSLAVDQPSEKNILNESANYGKATFSVQPYPWSMHVITMNPVREERLVLN